jgi:hypothetical protein
MHNVPRQRVRGGAASTGVSLQRERPRVRQQVHQRPLQAWQVQAMRLVRELVQARGQARGQAQGQAQESPPARLRWRALRELAVPPPSWLRPWVRWVCLRAWLVVAQPRLALQTS